MPSTIELYDWQKADVDKLAGLERRLLAHEMGLGKTYLAAELERRDVVGTNDNSLWVGPLGTLDGVIRKFIQLGMDVPLIRIDPKDRQASWRRFLNARGAIFFMHWEGLRLMSTRSKDGPLDTIRWSHVIADEVHRIQGRKTQQTRALKRLTTERKTAMSGTPVTGHPGKFWSCLNWLEPKNVEYTSYWRFYEKYVNYEIEYPSGYHKILGPKNEAELRERIDPYYVRHLKAEQCHPEHPDGVWDGPGKYYTQEWVELDAKQRKAYQQMEADMIAWVGEHEDEPLVASIAVVQMMRLQQFAVAYAQPTGELNKNGYPIIRLHEPSTKLDRAMQIIEDNPTEPVVIWSQFKQLIYLLEERCKKAKIDILLYTGDNRKATNGVEERDRNVQTFAAGGARVFAGTISAGGVGVDGLQASSSTMIFMDRTWMEWANKQAEDRLWRDGQKNAVQIIDIMAHNTVDLGRHQTLGTTWGWIKSLLDGPGRVQELFAD
jgi:SNF2 family DNA or RNA helicase